MPPELYGGRLRFVKPIRRAPHERHRNHRDLARRPKRADALRNYEKLRRRRARGLRRRTGRRHRLRRSRAAPRSGSARSTGTSRAARRCSRRSIVDELEAVCRSAADSRRARAVGCASSPGCTASSTTSAPSRRSPQELLNYVDRDAVLFQAAVASSTPPASRCSPARRRPASFVPTRTSIEIIQMVGGIAKIQRRRPAQIDHILDWRSTACATARRVPKRL